MQLPSQWLINIVKVLSFRLLQCLDPFAVLCVSGFSEIRLFRYLSKHIFQSQYLWKYIRYEGHIFGKYLKFNIDLKNQKKIEKKLFCF